MNLKTSTQATEITEMKRVSPISLVRLMGVIKIYFKALFFSVCSVLSVANCFSGMTGAKK